MSLVDDALALARSLSPGFALAEQAYHNADYVGGLLETLSQMEQRLWQLRTEIQQLTDIGIATDTDYHTYDILRGNLFATQMVFFHVLRRSVSSIDPRAAAQLPAPQMMPSLPWPPRMYKLAQPPPRPVSMDGLMASDSAYAVGDVNAEPPEASPTAAAPYFWAAAAIVVLVTLGVAVILGFTLQGAVQEMSRVFVVRSQTEQYLEFLQQRRQTFEACMAEQGADPESCLRRAGLLIPTPTEAGPQPPPPPTTEAYKWIVWTIGGLVVLTGGFLGYRMYMATPRKLPKAKAKAKAKTKKTWAKKGLFAGVPRKSRKLSKQRTLWREPPEPPELSELSASELRNLRAEEDNDDELLAAIDDELASRERQAEGARLAKEDRRWASMTEARREEEAQAYDQHQDYLATLEHNDDD